MTAYDPAQCGGLQYRPISEQVRVASAPDINLDTLSCPQLQANSFADCFTRLSQIRIWKDGNPDTADGPLVKDVNVFGGAEPPGMRISGCSPSPRPTASTTSPSRSTGATATTAPAAPRNELHREGEWRDVAIREPKRRDARPTRVAAAPSPPTPIERREHLGRLVRRRRPAAHVAWKPVRRSAGIREEPVHLGDVDGGRAPDVRRHELGGHPV